MTHPFEISGNGPAPYEFLGCERKIFQAHHSAPVQPGGTCDHCGTAITYMFHVRAANGHTFHVGSDCIAKIYSKGTKVRAWADAEVASEKKKAGAERLAERIAAAQAKLSSSPDLLTNHPHPNSYLASRSKTARDYVIWMLLNGGTKGKTEACKLIEQA